MKLKFQRTSQLNVVQRVPLCNRLNVLVQPLKVKILNVCVLFAPPFHQ